MTGADDPTPGSGLLVRARHRTVRRARLVRRRLRGLKLRTRITLATTLAVALGIGAGVLFAFLAVRAELMSGVDRQLDGQVVGVQKAISAGEAAQARRNHTGTGSGAKSGTTPGLFGSGFARPRRDFGDSLAYLQLINADGGVQRPGDQTVALPIDATDRAVAAGTAAEIHRTISFQGTNVRLVTAPLGDGLAVQVALPLGAEQSQLDQLGLELLAAGLAGILLSAGLGWAVTRTALRPVGQFTHTVERITATRDLAHRIDAGPRADRDEVGRLALSFNAMLDTVQDSTERQRQLVADASHELRTPLTSLRTNVEVLRKIELLDPEDRERLIASVLAGIDDLTALVADTVELARGEEPAAAVERLRWDAVADRVLDRARAHWPAVRFTAAFEPVTILGVPDRLQRAMANLLDNAAKFSGRAGGASASGGVSGSGAGSGSGSLANACRVEVGLTAAGFTVRDHGPGIPEADLPYVFDRFYRAASMRDRPGSGLGLAIVAQVAESHGGSVTAANHPGGGAVFTLSVPATDLVPVD